VRRFHPSPGYIPDETPASSERAATSKAHVYEVRPRKDRRGVTLISDALPFGRLWYGEPDAIGYAKFYSRSHHAGTRVFDEAGNVIKTHEGRASSKKVKVGIFSASSWTPCFNFSAIWRLKYRR
jgi:hypothetical protein